MRKGFTLIEVQVALATLVLAVAGMGAIIMNNLKQLQWLELRTQSSVMVPEANNSVVFTVIHSTAVPDTALNIISVSELTETPPVFSAKLTVTPK
ncbi:MAG: hypothetical protein WCS77_07035 [Elusimicrobiaceae bacterium]|jgi:hypothetical protein